MDFDDDTAEKPVPICPGKGACPIFSTTDQVISHFKLERNGAIGFQELMLIMMITKKFRKVSSCPFAVQGATKRESFRNTICKLRCEGSYSTGAVSESVGFSKTRVHQLEKSGMRKIRRKLERDSDGDTLADLIHSQVGSAL